ncbi:MAG: bacillithiol system redox-active protein YtxJ [Patescibacteria group bacterium]
MEKLTTIEGWLETKNLSYKQPVIVFKHSPSCGASARIFAMFSSADINRTITVPIYLVDVMADREMAKQIAEETGIKHESPQVLVLAQGVVVYDVDHDQINLADIEKHLIF